MKSISGPLLTLFNTKEVQSCGLYQITLIGGSNLYYCDADANVLWGGQTYSNGGTVGPAFGVGKKPLLHQKIGLAVSALNFEVAPGTAQINGVNFLTACRQGAFDGARLIYSEAFWAQSSTGYVYPIVPVGIIQEFYGRVAELDFGGANVTFTVNSFNELLNQNMPRNVWQAGCVNTLYDASCALNRATFAVNGTALTGSAAISISQTMTPATGYFDLGSVAFTSGANNGISRTVKTYTKGSPGTMTLIAPFPNAPANGDTFTAYPGCDKLQSTCTTKFNNLANFRGMPFVPENSTAV